LLGYFARSAILLKFQYELSPKSRENLKAQKNAKKMRGGGRGDALVLLVGFLY
jgi:hypothetical protein